MVDADVRATLLLLYLPTQKNEGSFDTLYLVIKGFSN